MEIHVPPRLRAYVRERHGKAGVAWADALPATVEHLSRRWSLEVIGAHPGSNRSLVVQASRREELVGLKIELCDTGQAGTLRALDGAAIGPGLLDVDPERGAMLMRWVVGRPLQVADPENLPRTRGLAVALAAVNTQPGVAPAPHAGAAMEQGVSLALRRLDRLGETPYRPDLLHEDRDALGVLLAGRAGGVLHGDLVPGNIIATPEGLCLVDPEPMTGPVERDLANWVHRAEHGRRAGAYLGEVMAAVPSLDADLLCRLVVFTARTYVAYRAALGRTVSVEHLLLRSWTVLSSPRCARDARPCGGCGA